MSLFVRFFLLMVCTGLAPVLVSGTWFFRSSQKAQQNAEQLHMQLAALSAGMVEEAVASMNKSLGFVQRIENARSDPDQELRLLQQAMVTHSGLSLLTLLDASGRQGARAADLALFPDQGLPAGSTDVVRRAAASGKLLLGPVQKLSGRPIVLLAYPLSAGRTLLAAYDLSDLWRKLRDLRVGTSGRIVLLDQAGQPLPGLQEDFPERDWKGPGELSGESGWLEYIRAGGRAMVGAYAATPSLGWRVLTLQPRVEAFAVGERFAFRATAFLLLLTLVAVSIAFWVARSLARPLEGLVQGAKRVAHDEFGRPVADAGWGELSLLSRAFNEMMKRLKAVQELNVERLLEEKAKVESLVHTIPDGIVLAALDGRIMYVNAAARGILCMGSLDTMPADLQLKHLLRQPQIQKVLMPILEGQKATGTAELDLTVQGKVVGTFLCLAVAVSSGAKPVGVLVILRDVTAERNLDRMKDEFLHSIVHDLRGPIGTIDGFVQIMRVKSALTEKEKTYIGYIEESCDRLKSLVSDILDSAKMEAGKLVLKAEPLDPAALAERLRKLYTLPAQGKQIEFKIELTPLPNPLVCDRELIGRVVMNLIGNALKFTPPNGRITLRMGPLQGGQGAEFSVQDTGHGIGKDKLELVFEKFKQLEQGEAARSGYGLGLAICRKIVELHGGRIWAESEPGQGAKFIFRLPYAPAAKR